VILAVIIIFIQRFILAKSFLKNTIVDFVSIISKGRNDSYEEKMEKLQGSGFVFANKINSYTFPSSRIIFPINEYQNIRPVVLAYFLYPRSIVKASNLEEVDEINKQDDKKNYLIFYGNYPNFEINARKIIVFGNSLKSEDQIVRDVMFKPEKFNNLGKFGIIELWK
jgi:hypothetical protein